MNEFSVALAAAMRVIDHLVDLADIQETEADAMSEFPIPWETFACAKTKQARAALQELVPAWGKESIWSDRTVPTPAGERIWVTDGREAWTLTGDGKVFPDSATKCRWWTPALADVWVPRLPNGKAPEKVED